jgi:hypothetical protein
VQGCCSPALQPQPQPNQPFDNAQEVFAKLKLLLRKAAERTVDATWQRIGQLLDAFPPQKCDNYLKNSHYASI